MQLINPHFHDEVARSSIEYLENAKGSVQIEFCVECGIPNTVICGADGT